MRLMRSSRASPRDWRRIRAGWLIVVALVLLAAVVGIVRRPPLPPGSFPTAAVGLVGVAVVVTMGILWPRGRRGRTPHDAIVEPLPRDRIEMLKRVRHHWIDGVLEDSLEHQTRIELRLDHWPGGVQQRRMELRRQGGDPEPLPAGTTISKIFDHVGGGLLVLGPPGSGKTTALLELARDLLDRAEDEPSRQIPVVCNLSSWARRPRPLDEWLVDELRDSYEVPRRIARYWIDHDEILPLLDGLDEVAASSRAGCVTAINTFLGERFVNLVVCSRTAEYQRLTPRLRLADAVALKPLTREQIADYLDVVGEPVAEVRAALENDETLWELLQSPLMLNIVTLACQGATADALPVAATGTLEQRRQQLFAAYTERMFARRPVKGRRYTKDQATRWLSWLARSMRQRGQSEFDLDRLQPDWLPTVAQRAFVTLAPALVSGLAGGVLVGLAADLVFGLIPGLVAGLHIGLVADPRAGLIVGLVAGGAFALVALGGGRVHEPVGKLRWPVLGLGVGLSVGLVFGLVAGLVFGLLAMGVGRIYEAARSGGIQAAYWPFLGVGLVFGLGVGVVDGLIRGVTAGLAAGLPALIAKQIYELVRGDGMAGARATIHPVEELHWSWPGLLSGLRHGLGAAVRTGRVFGLASGLTYALVGWLRGPHVGLDVWLQRGLRVGLGVGLSVGLGVLLVRGLVSGLHGGLAEKRVAPNEGIHRSARHGLVVGLLGGLVFGLVFGLGFGLVFGLRLQPVYGLGFGLSVGLRVGLHVGLISALIYMVVFALEFGGIACLRHLALRALLFLGGVAPLRYGRFLDDAADRLFLHRSGGSHIFVHGLLLEHFAGGEAEPPSAISV